MKTVKLAKMPKCDICGKYEAKVDGPTRDGPWAFMCGGCYEKIGIPGLGSWLEQAKPVPKGVGKEVAKAQLVSGVKDVMFDSVAEVECPHCGEIRRVEPDVNYTFTCEGCGEKLKCDVEYVRMKNLELVTRNARFFSGWVWDDGRFRFSGDRTTRPDKKCLWIQGLTTASHLTRFVEMQERGLCVAALNLLKAQTIELWVEDYEKWRAMKWQLYYG